MRTHYDLLGVRSDADDEDLRKAYHKAAKANHPDLNAGDPDAPRRFGQIATAIEILRNPKQRAAYDRSLDRQRQQRRLRRARIIIVIANAIAAAVLIAVLAGGHAPVGPTPSTSTVAGKVENNGGPRRAVMAGEQRPQRTEATGEDEPRRTLERGLPAGATGQQSEAVEREVAARREQDEHARAAELEPQTAEREAAPRREQDERRQARKARRSAAIAEAGKSGTSTSVAPTPPRAVQTTQTASSAASPRSFGPVEIAATRAFARF
jgi:curved DNA-binding protein CbpA